MPDTTPEPQRQARGQKRMQSLLAAAERVFADSGYEQATTNLIAARARVSPGTLYQFYRNKEAMAEALAKKYAEQLEAVHEGVFARPAVSVRLEELVDVVVDPFLDFHRRAPAFEALFVGATVSPALAKRVQALKETVTAQLVRLFEAHAPEVPKEDLFWAAEVSRAVFQGLLPIVTTLKGRQRTRAVQEMKVLFLRYLKPLLSGSAP